MTYRERVEHGATIGEMIQAVYDRPQGAISPVIISHDLYERAEAQGIDVTWFTPPPAWVDHPRLVGLSTDVRTGETVPVFDTEPEPRPPNRSQRRAEERRTRGERHRRR